jgi:hypothetical protein
MILILVRRMPARYEGCVVAEKVPWEGVGQSIGRG